jgi:hypothetical protein
MTTDNQLPAEDDLQNISDKLFHAYVDLTYTSMKELAEKYSGHVAMSIVLMTAANFAVQSHLAAGMTKDMVLDLIKGAIDDAEDEKEVAPH